MGEVQKGKQVVDREVTRTVTPGTVMESEVLGADQNNYLAAVWDGDISGLGFAFIDLSTGEFSATAFAGKDVLEDLGGELGRVAPAECLLPEKEEEAPAPISSLSRRRTSVPRRLR